MGRHPLHDPDDPFSPGVTDAEVLEMWVCQEAWPEKLSEGEVSRRIGQKLVAFGGHENAVEAAHDFMSNPPSVQ